METKKHRVFLDSNVILSGLFSERGAPRLILDVLSLSLPVLTGVTGRFNLTEIERNLEKKMAEALPAYRIYLPKLKLDIIPLPSREDPFADAKPRLSRRGRDARLRVNPEQAPAFMPGSRRVDLRPLVGTAEDKDLPVLASAVKGKADYFMTGDKKLISLIGRKGGFPFKPVSPAEFLDKVLPEILGGKHRG